MDVSNHIAFEPSVNVYKSTQLIVPENLNLNYYYYYYYCHPNANETLKYTFKERSMRQTIQRNYQFWEIRDSPSVVTEVSDTVEC